MKIGIIGAGASGLMAAISAAKTSGQAEIFMLEHNECAGKKILSTGNGRCNLTNEYMHSSCFNSENIELVRNVIREFGYEDTCSFFERSGLMIKSRNGYIYPRCGQASAVRELLVNEAKRLGVSVCVNQHVTSVIPGETGFRIMTGPDKKLYHADRVILSTGGKASVISGSDGSGYAIAKSFGHSLVPVVPALVQLKVKNSPISEASGVRADARIQAYEDGICTAEDTGELQITAYGISGIPAFQVSRHLAKALYEKKHAQVMIDFLPEITEKYFADLLRQLRGEKVDAEIGSCLNGIFADRLVPALLKIAGVRPRTWMKKLSDNELRNIAAVCKCVTLEVSGTNGFEHAQICAGGVDLKEIDSRTMESRYRKGLYLTGEILDADGICGGYNLQWAWATGYLAGIHAVK